MKKTQKEERLENIKFSWNYLNVSNWKRGQSDHRVPEKLDHKAKRTKEDDFDMEYLRVQAGMKTVNHDDA